MNWCLFVDFSSTRPTRWPIRSDQALRRRQVSWGLNCRSSRGSAVLTKNCIPAFSTLAGLRVGGLGIGTDPFFTSRSQKLGVASLSLRTSRNLSLSRVHRCRRCDELWRQHLSIVIIMRVSTSALYSEVQGPATSRCS